ncbi:hypothetical protein Plec18167_004585 [Paecilomyces lecythidis]|uniref:SnoaL-like domain-containing protein n=1 Tax=Paecilomyces lecythidis TaxID=3004212 RepID=A0ABR3XR95_9EURO
MARDLDHYITAFNNNDIETYSAYYAPDAQIALGGFILRGKEEILAFFKNARKQILEHIDPIHVIISENVIVLKAVITFTTIVDLNEV